jgi:hypothetical protein
MNTCEVGTHTALTALMAVPEKALTGGEVAQMPRPVPPRLIPLQQWFAQHGIPPSSGYVLIKRHGISLKKIGRKSFVTSDDDAVFVAAVLAGEAAGEDGQTKNLAPGRKRKRGDT